MGESVVCGGGECVVCVCGVGESSVWCVCVYGGGEYVVCGVWWGVWCVVGVSVWWGCVCVWGECVWA